MLNHRSVDKMSKKWYEQAKKILDPGDQILKSYPLRMNGKNGWLIITYQRMIFLHEFGFIKKNYSLIFDKRREDIKDVYREQKYGLSIVDTSGNVSKCVFELSSDIICSYLEKWIGESIPVHEQSVMIHT